MAEANWVYDLPAVLIIGATITVVIGLLLLIAVATINPRLPLDEWYFVVPMIGTCLLVVGIVMFLIGISAPSHTYFTQEEYNIDQMAVDYGAIEGDRSRPKLTAPNPDRYDEAVLIRTRAFGHECWIYYPAKPDEYAAYKNENESIKERRVDLIMEINKLKLV